MLLRLVSKSLWRRKERVALAILAVVMGTAITSSLITVSLNITEHVGRELRSFGANIVVTPNSTTIPLEVGGVNFGALQEERYIKENDLPKLKTIFWRHQIVAVTPYLYGLAETDSHTVVLMGTWFEKQLKIPRSSVSLPNGTVLKRGEETFTTGAKKIAPWWKIDGEWPSDNSYTQSLVGTSIARKLKLRVGDTFNIAHQSSVFSLTVTGIVATGRFEDDFVIVTLDNAQRILGKPDYVNKILVSALVKPDDELARKDHSKMTKEEHERWYCSPYIDVFTFQIEEAIQDVTAKPIRQVAETEGKLLSQNQVLFSLIAINSIGVSATAVASTMMASVLQRRREIGLMKAIGADNLQVAGHFLLEACIIGLLGGFLGSPAGYLLADFISSNVFKSPIPFDPLVLATSILVAVGVALVGSFIPVRKATVLEAATVMREG